MSHTNVIDENSTYQGRLLRASNVDDAAPIDSEVVDDHTCLFLSPFHPLTEVDICTLILKSAKTRLQRLGNSRPEH